MSSTETQITEEKHINLLVTLDEKYLLPLTVMLASYCAVHAGVATDLYVAHSSLEDRHFEKIKKAVSGENVQIHSIKITERYFRDIPVLERLPEESFYRLLAFLYLPENVERCLYLDPDIYILRSLLPLYEMEMGDACIAAAGHMHGLLNGLNRFRLSIQSERYINSGVMLMDLKKIRKLLTLETVLTTTKEYAQRLIMGDQDLCNILFSGHMIVLDEHVYNLDERTYRYFHKKEGFSTETVQQKTAILHYNGKYKPWLNGYKGVLDRFYPQLAEKGAAPVHVLRGEIKSIYRIIRLTKQQKLVVFGILLFLCACLCSYFALGTKATDLLSDPMRFRIWLDKFGPFDETVFILLRAAQTAVKFIPAAPLEMAAGYAWGAVPGMIYCIAGNLLGTLLVLFLTKKYGYQIIDVFFPVKSMKTLDLFRKSDKIYALSFFLYLIPGLPKDGFTYFAGLLPIRMLPFVLLTTLARIPSVLSSTFCGATLAEKQYVISGLLFAASVLLTVLGGILYRAIIRKKEAKPHA